jgi:hypothetical protein
MPGIHPFDNVKGVFTLAKFCMNVHATVTMAVVALVTPG